MMILACVSPSSILIHVSGPTFGSGERNTMFRTPCPHPGLLYPPYLRWKTQNTSILPNANPTESLRLHSPSVFVKAEYDVLCRLALAPLVSVICVKRLCYDIL